MRYTVLIEPIRDTPDMEEGWFYARVPALEVVTQGKGVDGALTAAQEACELWVECLREEGKPIPVQDNFVVTQLQVAEVPHAVQAA